MSKRFESVEPIPQSISERGSANDAGQDGGQRHAYLNDDEEATGIVDEAESDARAVVAVSRQLL